MCYCRETEPTSFDKENDDDCTKKCPGNNNDICGGSVNYFLITVSEIGKYHKKCTCLEVSKLHCYI